MSGDSVVLLVLGGLLSGGIGLKLLERFFATKDGTEKETAAIKAIQVSEHEAMRQELQQMIDKMEAKMEKIQDDESIWRTKYWEAQGARAAQESELVTFRSRNGELIQQNQALIAEVETYKIKEGRREEDRRSAFQTATEDALTRIESAGDKAVVAAQKVATELHESQGRADDIKDGAPGEAADEASRSGKEGR